MYEPYMYMPSPWLCPALEVVGTTPNDLEPAIHKVFPKKFKFDVDTIAALLTKIDTFTISLLGDAHASNINIQERWAHKLENEMRHDPRIGARCRLLPGLCETHAVSLCKKRLTQIREHLMRHFGLAAIGRLRSVNQAQISNVEKLIDKKRVTREVGPEDAEAGDGYLRRVVDALFKLDAEHHKRKNGHSVWHNDLLFMCQMCNGPKGLRT